MAKLKATSVAGDLTVTGKVTSTVAGATTSTIGTVKLNNATNSTSTTEAATAAAVKAAYDLANGKANASHGNHVPGTQTANNAVYLRNDNTWQTITPDKIGAAAASHSHTQLNTQGNNESNIAVGAKGGVLYLNYQGAADQVSAIKMCHGKNSTSALTDVHAKEFYAGNGSNRVYHTGYKPSAADIGAAAASHGNHVPGTQTANNAVYLRNDNTWQTITPDKIGAATSGHTHNQTFYADTRAVNYNPNTAPSEFRTTFQQNNTNGVSDGGSYYTLMHIPRYNHSSGGFGNQMAFTDNNNVFVRRGTSDTAWGSWYKIYHSGAKPTLSELGAAASNHGHSNATTSAHGFMSNTDKSKLDGIATGANKYTHPTGAGNNHIPSGGASGQFLKWSSSGVAVWAADNNTWRGIQDNLTSTATDQSLSANQGKLLNDNKANYVGALNHKSYSKDLNTQTGIGIYGYTETTPGKPSEFGTVLQWANTPDAKPGVNQHWITQLGSSSYGRLYYRHRTNTATSYPSWNPLIQESDFGLESLPDTIQKSFYLPNGLRVYTGWYDVNPNSTRTINYPSGTFNKSTAMPNVSLCAPDGDWENFQTSGDCVVISFDLYKFSLANYGGKKARVVAWVVGH